MSSDFAAPLEYAGALERSGEGRRPMDEREFQIFYAQTCRALRAYSRGAVRDRAAADDLLQETYYRYLKAAHAPEDIEGRRGYLFRIAFNLVRDTARATGRNREIQADALEASASPDDVGLRADLREALETLDPKDRMRLWLAYVNGSSHREIAAATGVGETSVRPLVLRARRRLADLLRKRGFGLERLPKGAR
jgi:RNA polymerase sigma-70 factor (ECF subfamily)